MCCVYLIFQSGMEVKTEIKENADESQTAATQKSEDHKKLLEYGIHELVADRLDEIYKSGKIVIKNNLIDSYRLHTSKL